MQVGAGGVAHWDCMLGGPAAAAAALAPLFAPVSASARSATCCACAATLRGRRAARARAARRRASPRRRSASAAAAGARCVAGAASGLGAGGERLGARAQALDGRGAGRRPSPARGAPGEASRAGGPCCGRLRRRGVLRGAGRCAARARRGARPARRARAALSRATMPFSSPSSASIRRWPWRMLSSSRSERSRAARSASSPRWISSARRSSSASARLQLAARRVAQRRALGGRGLLGLGELRAGRSPAAAPARARRCSLALRRALEPLDLGAALAVERRCSALLGLDAQLLLGVLALLDAAQLAARARRAGRAARPRAARPCARAPPRPRAGAAAGWRRGVSSVCTVASAASARRIERGLAALGRAARAAFGQQIALASCARPRRVPVAGARHHAAQLRRRTVSAPLRPSRCRLDRYERRAPCRAPRSPGERCVAEAAPRVPLDRAATPARSAAPARATALRRRQAIRDCSDHSSMKPGRGGLREEPTGLGERREARVVDGVGRGARDHARVALVELAAPIVPRDALVDALHVGVEVAAQRLPPQPGVDEVGPLAVELRA